MQQGKNIDFISKTLSQTQYAFSFLVKTKMSMALEIGDHIMNNFGYAYLTEQSIWKPAAPAEENVYFVYDSTQGSV